MMQQASQWRTLGRVVFFLLGCTFVLAVAASLPLARPGPGQALAIGFVASLGSLALTVLFVRWDGLRLRDVGAMPIGKSPGHFAVGFMLGLSLVALHSYLVDIAGHVRWTRTPGGLANQVSVVVAGYLFLSAREELAFHGYPLRRLQTLFGVWGAQSIIAAVFALEHVAGGWPYGQALWGAATGSLLFGMAAIATRGLAVPIGIHAAWNIGDWARGNRAEPGLWRPEVEKGFEAAASSAGIWSYVGVMALATLGFWYLHRAQKVAQVGNA
jgi:membrane protease YdiL (CAAX protease family)